MTRPPSHVVNLRAAPDLKLWRPPATPPIHSARLDDRVGLVIVAAGARDAMPEAFGLKAYLEMAGAGILGGGIVTPDHLGPAALAEVRAVAESELLPTITGPRPWALSTLAEFYEPNSGLFARRTYTGAGWCIGAELGRTFGLPAEHCGPRMEPNGRTWELWPPGWGREHEHGRWKKRSPHRPPLWVTARRVGWKVEFAPCGTDRQGQPAGKRMAGGSCWRGAFLDVLALGYAFDGDRGASFAEHCANFGVEAAELPVTVAADAHGVRQITQAVRSVHELAILLDRRAAL